MEVVEHIVFAIRNSPSLKGWIFVKQKDGVVKLKQDFKDIH